MKWYMTVGYPGGEFAWQADPSSMTRYDVRDKIAKAMEVCADLTCIGGFTIRPCPPDLAEWIEAEMGVHHKGRCKVAGGWIEEVYESFLNHNDQWSERVVAAVYVPVAGAAGLTVVGEGG